MRNRIRITEVLGIVLLIAVALLVSPLSFAQAIDDIRVSRTDRTATIEIELVCGMRYVNHQQNRGGAELHVDLAPGHDCRLALRDVLNDMRRPMSGRLAHLAEVEFQQNQSGTATMILRFDRALAYEVKQTLNEHMLTVEVDTRVASAPVEVNPPTPDLPETKPENPVPAPNRTPTRLVRNPPAFEQNLFVIRVTDISPDHDIDYTVLENYRSKLMYSNEIVVGTRRWAELKLGFFDTEAEAQQVLIKLSSTFPTAWITIANPSEQVAAEQNRIKWPEQNTKEVSAPPAVAAAPTVNTVATISDERIVELMSEAKSALLRRDYPKSIELYEQLLVEPGDQHRREAREFLGVAREKNDEHAQARAEYEMYLTEFPDGDESERVQQRLAALTSVGNTPPNVPQSAPGVAENAAPPTSQREVGSWEFYGSASQYYLRGVNLAEGSAADFIAQSAMLSQAHLVAKRRGERFDLTARSNLSYLYDLVKNGSGQQALISYAYLDIDDTKTDISARIGRQHQLSGGVLGRFDGLHASYRYRPDMTVNVSFGFPVDSPRFQATSDHSFYGASVDFDNLISEWDLSVYVNQQTVDGISDREAFGAEAQFQNSKLNLVGLLDYDASYSVINTALINGSWRFHDRLTLHGRVRSGVAPFLTTRNAIIGQQVNTVRELFDSYTEGQIRRLARDRTAEEVFAAGGLSAAITPRLQLKFDTSYLKYSGRVQSGGVGPFLESGPQYTYGGHLQGSGYFKPGQVLQLGYRHTERQSIDDDTLWFDLRYPFGEQLRMQARLSLTNRTANQNVSGDIDQLTLNPLLRLVYSGERRYRIEFEAGAQLSDQEYPLSLAPPLAPDGQLEQRDYYVQLGYILDF